MRTNERSCHVLAEGSVPAMRDKARDEAKAIVTITTDDAEIALGYLLRDDERSQVRVGIVVADRMRDRFEMGRRQRFQIVAIDRRRITSMRVLG